MSDLSWKTRPLELIYSHCLIRLYTVISSENNDLRLPQFSKKFHLNALGSKI